MGVFGFLKKGKAKTKENADVPPIPPPSAGFLEKDFGEELPPSEEGLELPTLPEMPDIRGDFEEAMPELPDMPKLPEDEMKTEPVGEELPIISEPVTEEPVKIEIKKTKPIFIRADVFKNSVLKNLTLIRNEIKDFNAIQFKLDSLAENENHSFKEWHNKMSVIEKDLMSIDNILFKSAQGSRIPGTS